MAAAWLPDLVAAWVAAAAINCQLELEAMGHEQICKRIRQALSALREWWRGASGTHTYDAYLQHAERQNRKPLTAQQFYLDDIQRKYSRPNRCC